MHNIFKQAHPGKVQLDKEVRGCWPCLQVGHRMNNCRNKKPCDVDDCIFYHYPTLHDEGADKVLYSVNASADNGERKKLFASATVP